MREYGLVIFALATLICTLGFFAYKGGRDVAVRMALSVIVVHAALMPVFRLVSEDVTVPELDFDVDDYEAEYINVARDAFCLGIERAVCSEYSIEGVRVSAFGFDFATMRAERVLVILSGSAALADYKSIERYVNSMDVGRCEVKIEIG